MTHAGTQHFQFEIGQDLTSAADASAYFVAPERCEIIEVGVRVVTLLDVGAGFVGKFESTPNSGGTRGDGNIGVLTKTADVAIGKTLRKFVNVQVNKGDLVHFQVTDAADTGGTGVAYIRYYPAGAGAVEAADVDSE